MNRLEKSLAVLIGLCIITGAFAQVYKAGERHAWRTADAHYAAIIAERVSEGIKGYQRVQKIREESEYQRGHDACMSQF